MNPKVFDINIYTMFISILFTITILCNLNGYLRLMLKSWTTGMDLVLKEAQLRPERSDQHDVKRIVAKEGKEKDKQKEMNMALSSLKSQLLQLEEL